MARSGGKKAGNRGLSLIGDFDDKTSPTMLFGEARLPLLCSIWKLAKLIVNLSACWGFNPDRDLTLDVMILALIERGTSAILISNATEVCKSFQRDFSQGRTQLYQSLKQSNKMIKYEEESLNLLTLLWCLQICWPVQSSFRLIGDIVSLIYPDPPPTLRCSSKEKRQFLFIKTQKWTTPHNAEYCFYQS